MTNNEGFPALVPESTPAPQAPVGAEYDYLFGQSEPFVPSTDEELAAAIENAAVRPVVTANPGSRYIAPPTTAQAENAKKYGFNLDDSKKYYAPVEWENRDRRR